jgi:hypothetical protein
MIDQKLIRTICEEIQRQFDLISRAEALSDGQPRSHLYHYTTAQGFLGIIQTKHLWATNVLYLNDATELSDARDILQTELQASPILLLGTPSRPSSEISAVFEHLPLEHFIVSFCQDGDLLSQWRGYGSQGNGFSMGFSLAALAAVSVREENTHRGSFALRKVKYHRSEKVDLIKKRLSAINQILDPHAEALRPESEEDVRALLSIWNRIAACFHPVLALMKHPSFEEEHEWRLVRTLWRPPVPTVDWPVSVRMIGTRLSPYLPISWPLQAKSPLDGLKGIEEIRCGPSSNPVLKEMAARDLLIAEKSWHTRLVRSEVPLRA